MIKNPLSSLQPDSNKLLGIYRGVVEDNKSDPLKSGRIKVRVFGIHTHIKEKTSREGIPTEELPWSQPALSLFEGSVSGFGAFIVPLQGSHVFIFFESGNPMKPIYFASAPGVPTEEVNTEQGFNDPDGLYPTIGRTITYKENGEGAGSSTGDDSGEEVEPTEESDIQVTINRIETSLQGTKGELTTNTDFSCKTLELPWKDNENMVSCIPVGTYNVEYYSGNKYWVKDVSGRTGILIHTGNVAGSSEDGYRTDSDGCILLGTDFGELYGQVAVLNSSTVINNFNTHLQQQSFTLTIENSTDINMEV